MSQKLTLPDYQAAAARLGVDVATIRAVVSVESGGAGFLPDGRLIIRYEPHVFSRYTKGRFDEAHPTLSYGRWVPGYPKSVSHSHQLLAEAAKLDGYCAGLSCSYGLFQIMGFNFSACGCATFKEFYGKMAQSEGAQLLLFCAYVVSSGLAGMLQQRNWAGFARRYNGAGYAANKYDVKLAAAYARYSK